MIHKIHKGKLESFKRALDYNLDKPETSIIGGNMLGQTTDELLEEFRRQQALNPDCRRSMVHAMIRLPPDEHLDGVSWYYVAERYMQHLGYHDAPYVVFLEELGEHNAHIHIVASCIRDDGTRVDDSNDYYRGQKVMRELEEELGLRRVPSSHEVGIHAPELDEMHSAVRRGEPTDRRMLQKAILEAARSKPTLSELIDRLERAGVDIRPKLRRDGLLTGMTYRLPSGAVMKGTHLGRAFTARGLSKYLHIDYDPKRDLPALERALLRFDARESREAALAYLRLAIDHDLADRPSLPELLRRLDARGIGATPNLARTGHLSGLSYMIHDHTFKASELGRDYTPKGLEKRGVGYDPEHHHDQLRGLAAPSPPADGPLPPLASLRELIAEHGHPALAEHDWAQRAARHGIAREQIVDALYEAGAGAALERAERRSYVDRVAERARQAQPLDAFAADPRLAGEPLLTERVWIAHAHHHGVAHEDVARQLLGLGETAAERDDLERLLAALPHDPSQLAELPGPAGDLELAEEVILEPRLTIEPFDVRIVQLRDDLQRAADRLVDAAGELRRNPSEDSLRAYQTRWAAWRSAERDLHRATAGLERSPQLQKESERLRERLAKPTLDAAHGEAHVRAERMLRTAYEYDLAPEPRLLDAFYADRRRYLQLHRTLEPAGLPLTTPVVGAESPEALRTRAERSLDITRATQTAQRALARAERFFTDLRPEDLEAFERAQRRAQSLIDKVGPAEALNDGERLRLLAALGHMGAARGWASLGSVEQRLPERPEPVQLPLPGALRAAREGELYKVARELHERVGQLGEAPARKDLQVVAQLRRRFETLRGELERDPAAPTPNWQTVLGTSALERAQLAERLLARQDHERAARGMLAAAERGWAQPGTHSHVRDFYRAKGALRHAAGELERLGLTPETAVLARAELARRLFAAIRLRETAGTLATLTERAQPEQTEQARRGFERALTALLRELPASTERRTLEAGIWEGFRTLARARGDFERLPAETTAQALEAARRGLAERYRQLDDLHRRLIAEHVPQVAAAHETALAAQAQLALERYRALAAEVIATHASWQQLPPIEPLPPNRLEAVQRELERLELRWAEALAEPLAPLRRQLQDSELRFTATRLQALYQARAELPTLSASLLRQLSDAEGRFLRAARRLDPAADAGRHFRQQIDPLLRRSLDELRELMRPRSGALDPGPSHEQFHATLTRLASAITSHQRFHHALPELRPMLDARGLGPLRAALEQLQKTTDSALQGATRFNLSTRLAEFVGNPRPLAARAADQLWADRAALGGLSTGYIREQLLARGAHRFDRAIPDPVAYVEQVATRARDLAERTRIRLGRRSSGLGSLALLALPAELRLAAHAAGLLTGKATPLGIASFTVSLAQLTWHYLERAGRDSEERGR